MARLSKPQSPESPRRAQWIVLAVCALGIGVAAVVMLRWTRSDPAPVAGPSSPTAPPSTQARVAPPTPAPASAPRTEAPASLEPARPEPPVPEPRLGADGVLAVPLVVPIYSSTIPEVRLPAGARSVRLLIDIPLPDNIDGLSVFVRGPEGRVRARVARAVGSPGLAVEVDTTLRAGVHEVLVTYEDESTAAQHRINVVPAGAAPDSPSPSSP